MKIKMTDAEREILRNQALILSAQEAIMGALSDVALNMQVDFAFQRDDLKSRAMTLAKKRGEVMETARYIREELTK